MKVTPNNSFKPSPLRGPSFVVAFTTTPCRYAGRLNSSVRFHMQVDRDPWYKNGGAEERSIAALCAAVEGLPLGYLKLLRNTDGAEAEFLDGRACFCLDNIESALSYFESGTYTTDNVFVFGGTGGTTLFAFDLLTSKPFRIVEYDPIDPEGSMQVVATDFDSFIKLLPPYET